MEWRKRPLANTIANAKVIMRIGSNILENKTVFLVVIGVRHPHATVAR